MKQKKIWIMAVLLIAAALGLAGCGGSKAKTVDPKTAAYDDMVAWLTDKGFIEKDAVPVDINETTGYLTDNTGGQFTEIQVADKACDYNGLWLFWWNPEGGDYDQVFSDMANNAGTILLGGGAAFLETDAVNGAYAIAFSEDYTKKEDALKAFQELKSE